jgi:hypothetical protein
MPTAFSAMMLSFRRIQADSRQGLIEIESLEIEMLLLEITQD